MLMLFNTYPHIAGRVLQVVVALAVALAVAWLLHTIVQKDSPEDNRIVLGEADTHEAATWDVWRAVACLSVGVIAGSGWILGAVLAPVGVMRGVNDIIVLG